MVKTFPDAQIIMGEKENGKCPACFKETSSNLSTIQNDNQDNKAAIAAKSIN